MKKDARAVLRLFNRAGKKMHRDASGLDFIIVKAGGGRPPVRGCRVSVLYRMYLATGALVDSSWKRSHPFVFKVGSGGVVKGFETAVTLLKKGGRTISFIPSKLGYGRTGLLPLIPRDNDLVCDVELVSFDPPIGPDTVVMGNPCIAVATIERILCCAGDQRVFLKGDSALIAKKLFDRPVTLSELLRQLSKDFDLSPKQLVRFIEGLIDKGVAVVK